MNKKEKQYFGCSPAKGLHLRGILFGSPRQIRKKFIDHFPDSRHFERQAVFRFAKAQANGHVSVYSVLMPKHRFIRRKLLVGRVNEPCP